MKCKYCRKNVDLPDFLFCPYCGEKQVRADKTRTVHYPKPKILADGSLSAQIMVDGRRETIKAKNEKEYKAKVDALRTGLMEMKAHPEKRTLDDVIRSYIDKNEAVLSPASVRGFEVIYKHRFPKYMKKPICDIDFQGMINDEIKAGKSAKTILNAWGLVKTACNAAGIQTPSVNLPQVVPPDGDFLDYGQIQTFLAAVKGDSIECAALLLLHGLRISEALKLSADDISNDTIHVRGAVVADKHNKMVEKPTNKNTASNRDVPIMIPRLKEILPENGPLITIPRSTLQYRITKICTKAGLPPCSPHDLRRSFASLAKHLDWSPDTLMQLGGWNNMATVNRIYAKLAEMDKNSDVQRMKNYYQITTD